MSAGSVVVFTRSNEFNQENSDEKDHIRPYGLCVNDSVGPWSLCLREGLLRRRVVLQRDYLLQE